MAEWDRIEDRRKEDTVDESVTENSTCSCGYSGQAPDGNLPRFKLFHQSALKYNPSALLPKRKGDESYLFESDGPENAIPSPCPKPFKHQFRAQGKAFLES